MSNEEELLKELRELNSNACALDEQVKVIKDALKRKKSHEPAEPAAPVIPLPKAPTEDASAVPISDVPPDLGAIVDDIKKTADRDVKRVAEIKKVLDSYKDLANIDITPLLRKSRIVTKEEQVNAFGSWFKKTYEISDDDYKALMECMSENKGELFEADGKFKPFYAESLCLNLVEKPKKDGVAFKMPAAVDMPERYKGIKTLKDLIDRYDSQYEELEKKKKETGDPKQAELEMHKILEAMDKYSEKISPVVRINFYKTYLNLKPENEVLKGIVLYNTGCAYMNDLQKDETALSYFKRALEISKKEYAANPGSKDAERRRVKYQCGLEACEENIKKANKVVLLTV